MRNAVRFLALLVLLAAPSVADAAPRNGAGGRLINPLPAKAGPTPRVASLAAFTAPERRLAALDHAALRLEDALNPDPYKRLRFGVGRDLALDLGDGEWLEDPAGGRIWTADLVSEGALGTRLHVERLVAPRGAELLIYSPERPDRLHRITPNDAPLWSRTVPGERTRFELRLPAGANPKAAELTIKGLQHHYKDPLVETREQRQKEGDCHNDVACYEEWSEVAAAVAGYGTVGRDSLWCTGQLINPANDDQTPLFMTAHHCVSGPSEAENLEVYWFFQAATCEGQVPSVASLPSSVGVSWLQGNSATDHALLMVEGSLPEGVTWAGWDAAEVAVGTNVTGIHHPDGAYKRISFGARAASSPVGYITVDWNDGPTEPGSSGSGIFRDDSQAFVGQLFGGDSACGRETTDEYGALSDYYDEVETFLEGGSDDLYENNDTCAGARAIPYDAVRDLVVKSVDPDWYAFDLGPGESFELTVEHRHADGDIDLRLYEVCGRPPVEVSSGQSGVETLQYRNNLSPRTIFVEVFLASDTRNNYVLYFDEPPPPPPPPPDSVCANPGEIGTFGPGMRVDGELGSTDPALAFAGRPGRFYDTYVAEVAEPGTPMTLDLYSDAGLDTFLYVFDPNDSCRLIASDDDGGSGLNSQLTLPLTGNEYIVATSYSGGTSGTYTLSTNGFDDPLCDQFREADPLRRGVVLSGALEESDVRTRFADRSQRRYLDNYPLEVPVGEAVEIGVEGSDGLDSMLYVYDLGPDGDQCNLVYTDDDGAGGTDSFLAFTVEQPNLQVVVTSYQRNYLAGYRLEVGPAELCDLLGDERLVSVGQFTEGNLDPEDPDFSFDSRGPRRLDDVRLSLPTGTARVTVDSPDFRPAIYVVSPTDEGCVIRDSQAGRGQSVQIDVGATRDPLYLVVTDAGGGPFGSWSLNVSDCSGEEICDGVDNDCNDITDDVPGLGEACENGLPGACFAAGVLECDLERRELACVGGDVERQPEFCDGQDNDCDGVTDSDTPGFGEACDNGRRGICFGEGFFVCDGVGDVVCDAPGRDPEPEVCDGLDNDCDGVTDRDVQGLGMPCTNGQLGVCQAFGVMICPERGGDPVCDAPQARPGREICDGLDNNCDGVVDFEGRRGFVECEVEAGGCAGRLACVSDSEEPTCVPLSGDRCPDATVEPTPSVEPTPTPVETETPQATTPEPTETEVPIEPTPTVSAAPTESPSASPRERARITGCASGGSAPFSAGLLLAALAFARRRRR